MNVAALAKLAPRPSRPKEKGIIIREQPLRRQQEQLEAKTSDKNEDPEIKRKGKKPLKKTPIKPSSEPILFLAKEFCLK